MSPRPRLLDTFCGAGGAAMGYARAGFDVVGVDIVAQPRYPFEFIRADALSILADLAYVRGFDAVHASPPCQAGCALTKGTNAGRVYPQLIPPTRALLDALGLPYVIENVAGAPVRKDITLCGEMFGLAVIRHRFFELSGWSMPSPRHLPHRGRVAGMRHGVWYSGPYFAVYGDGGGQGFRPAMAGRHGHRLDRRPPGDRRGDPARLHRTDRPSPGCRTRSGGRGMRRHDAIPTIPMFPEPERVGRRSPPPLERPAGWAKCPACTAPRTAVVRVGTHLAWRGHDRITFSGAKIPCPTSGVPLCRAAPKPGPEPSPLCRHDAVPLLEAL